MAWTTPRTWKTGELEDPTILNAHIRDNFNATAVGIASAANQLFYATAANVLTTVNTPGVTANALYGGALPVFSIFSTLSAGAAAAVLVTVSVASGSPQTLISSGVTVAGIFGVINENTVGLGTINQGLVDATHTVDLGSTGSLVASISAGALIVTRTAGTKSYSGVLLAVYQ